MLIIIIIIKEFCGAL